MQDVQRELWVLSVVLYGLASWLGPQSPEEAADLEAIRLALVVETLCNDRQQVGLAPAPREP